MKQHPQKLTPKEKKQIRACWLFWLEWKKAGRPYHLIIK